MLLLWLTAASVGWSEFKPVWHQADWWPLWALGLASLGAGVLLVRSSRHPVWGAALVLLLLVIGQRRSLELALMLAAWGLRGFAP